MRIFPLLSICFLLITSLPALADSMDTEEIIYKARSFAEEKKFTEALSLLKEAQDAMPSNPDIRLARARTLSWMGKYDEAQHELDIMTPLQQKNADVRLLQAYLYYYQKDFEKSVLIFGGILAEYPDYVDAQEGLVNVRRAMSPEAVAESYKWQSDIGYEYSKFSRRNQKAWNQQFFQLNHFSDDRKTVVHGRIERYNQFASIDSVFQTGVSHIFSPRLSGYISGAMSPDADFRPDWRISAGGAARLDDPSSLPAVWMTLDARRDDYTSADVWSINPAIRVEPYDGWAVTGKMISVKQQGEDRLYGQELKLDGTIKSGWRFRIGYADAPETEAGVTVDTETFFGGMSVELMPRLTLHIGYTRDDRENSYIRNVYNVAISRKF